jgi:hypothetical protein
MSVRVRPPAPGSERSICHHGPQNDWQGLRDLLENITLGEACRKWFSVSQVEEGRNASDAGVDPGICGSLDHDARRLLNVAPADTARIESLRI